MSTLELPRTSKTIIFITLIALAVAYYRVAIHGGGDIWLVLIAFVLSGFIADLFTALAHFSFDYVWPDEVPILGPISVEFREHHDCPTLDPSNYQENFTKGSYGSLFACVLIVGLSFVMSDSSASFLVLATLLGISTWAFFFHQIHSYAHMGSTLPPEEFKRRVVEISQLSNKAEQIQEFDKLFQKVPIPPVIRFLQRCHLILNPKTHNLHHISFISDFSSVNGWSDPLLNIFLRPIAVRIRAKSGDAHP
jgi:hypothetical protein